MKTPYRKTFRRFHQPGDLHELTFSCYRRLPLLTNDACRIELARCIDDAGSKAKFDLVAFVFMPEHVHLLIFPREHSTTTDNIAGYLAQIKQPLSKHVSAMLPPDSPLAVKLTVQERPGKTCFRFWQEGPGYDRNLTSPSAVRNASR